MIPENQTKSLYKLFCSNIFKKLWYDEISACLLKPDLGVQCDLHENKI